MTEPKETAPDGTEPIEAPDAVGATDTAPETPPPPSDDEAARAEAEAAASAADEVGGEDETSVEADEDETEAEDHVEAEPDDDFDDVDETEAVGAPAVTDAGSGAVVGATALAGRKVRGATLAPAPVAEPAIRIKDRASKIFVLGTVLVFALVFLNGMLLGTGGTFHPYITPTPPPSESAAPSESVAPSGSLAPSGSSTPSGSLAPSGSVAPSAVPSSSPVASGSPAPS
jgi:hypothetical protein